MALELITGPANSAKARCVLDGMRAAASREPMLVVPTAPDVEHYRRELAGAGAVLGLRVERFAGLVELVARRVGVAGLPISGAARRRLLACAVSSQRLETLADSADTPGFLAELETLVAELEARRVSPARLRSGLGQWAGADADRRNRSQDVCGLYQAYRVMLERVRGLDSELYGALALDGLRLAPARWGATPVFFYGFDDLTALELDAVETLTRVTDVTFALDHEVGREAFAGRAGLFEDLRALASRHVELPAAAEHYAGASRAALHHLERRLFEPSAERVEPAAAVRLLEGGGERAELELVAAEILSLRREGFAAEEIVVVVRPGDPAALVVGSILDAHGIPNHADRTLTFDRTPLGRGALALMRSALLGGTSADLLTWLRTPGLLERPELADHLEATVMREALGSASDARTVWERERWRLDALDRLAVGAQGRRGALLDRVRVEIELLFEAPRRRRAPVLDELEAVDARALTAAVRALEELTWLAGRDSRLTPGPGELHDILAALTVLPGQAANAGSVAVVDPLALRARRVRALIVCGLQEGVFPRPERSAAIFPASERAQIAQAAGIVLDRDSDALRRERNLFYTLVSRPQERLVLSFRSADDEGFAAVRSMFVDDVGDHLDQGWWDGRRVRALGACEWPVGEAPDAGAERRSEVLRAPRRREVVIRALTSPFVSDALAGRPAWSASGLEAWAGCPVRWFVERFLNARDLRPDPEPLVRGSLSHAVLESTLRRLASESGVARLDAERLPLARRLLAQEIAEQAPHFRISANNERRMAVLRRLEVDLGRYLEFAAGCGTRFDPRHLELAFGFDGDDPAHPGAPAGRPAVELERDGRRVALRGRVDRVDVDAEGRAIVYDYKGAQAPESTKWLSERAFQVPLYMLAVRELLDVEPVGGFYQPLSARDIRPRGVIAEGVDDDLACVGGDRRPASELVALLDGALEQALRAADEARTGALEPRPLTCAYNGGCAHPVICRIEAS